MLIERIFSVETAAGPRAANLPEALARLCDHTLIGFDGLASHQRHAWDLFLFQTAAMALVRGGEADAADDEAAWRRLADPDAWRALLTALTPGSPGAWSLVVDDLTRPAFMQPPIGAGSLAGYVRPLHAADPARLFRTRQFRHRPDEWQVYQPADGDAHALP